MTISKALHPSDNIDRFYMTRQEGGRGFASVEDCIDVTIQSLEEYDPPKKTKNKNKNKKKTKTKTKQKKN